jgi:predicted N-acyltransferase
LSVKRQETQVAIIPFFIMDFSLTTLIRGPLQKLIFAIRKIFPRFLSAKIAFVGSPTTEKFYLGISCGENLEALMDGALKALYAFCRKEKIPVLLFYNLTAKEMPLANYLKERGFCAMENLPSTMVEIDEDSLEGYIKNLGKSTRKNLRRILRALPSSGLKTETLDDITGLIEEIYKLYLNTVAASDIDFEVLPKDFFRNICLNMPGRAKYFITRDAKNKVIAFNLCLIKGDICIDKFVGFDHEALKNYRLYYVSFLQNIEWCLKNKIRFYQPGQADYDPKIRLGAKLIPLYIYLKAINPVINLFKGPVAAIIAPRKFDPALRNLGKYKRKDLWLA